MQVEGAGHDCMDEQRDIVISISHPAWADVLGEIEAVCVAAAEAALVCGLKDLAYVIPALEISIVLADDAQMHAWNLAHRGRDSATDVLSFPSMTSKQLAGAHDPAITAPVLLGDIVLAFQTVQKDAGEQGKALHAHVSHLVAHGVLHLLGFDHDAQDGASRMEGLERAALRQLGIADPYVVE